MAVSSGSLSFLPSSTSASTPLFHSNASIIDAAPSTSHFGVISSKRTLRSNPRLPRLRVRLSSSYSPQSTQDGSVDQFLDNNTISDYMRFKTGVDRGTGELQTAVVTYRKRFPWSILRPFLRVDLVSAIHVADKEYFSALQKELEDYDCVLYEMVASRDMLEKQRKPTASTRLKKSRPKGFSILGFIQRQMGRVLRLDFQLDCLDYEAENWYHADLDFETFKLLQLEKGESLFTFARDMTLRSVKAMVQPASTSKDLEPWRSKLLRASRVLPMPLVGFLIIGSLCADVGSRPSDYPELEALFRLDFSAALKVFLAKRLTSEFTTMTADVEEKSVIIGERNKAAALALQKAIDEGHNKIAILYGGGHMPDLGRRLQKEFSMAPSEVQWVTAWTIKNRDITLNSLPILSKMAKISGWPLNRYQTFALLICSSILAVDLWLWELFFGTVVNWTSEIAEGYLKFFS